MDVSVENFVSDEKENCPIPRFILPLGDIGRRLRASGTNQIKMRSLLRSINLVNVDHNSNHIR
jgi:hypothetical protein